MVRHTTMTKTVCATMLAIALAASGQAMAQTPAETRAAQALAAQAEATYCTPAMLAKPKESARCHAAAARALQKQAEDSLAKLKLHNAMLDLQSESMARIADAYAKGTAAGRQQEIIEKARGWHKPYVTCRTSTIGSTTFTNCD
jgi:hypothetical protein